MVAIVECFHAAGIDFDRHQVLQRLRRMSIAAGFLPNAIQSSAWISSFPGLRFCRSFDSTDCNSSTVKSEIAIGKKLPASGLAGGSTVDTWTLQQILFRGGGIFGASSGSSIFGAAPAGGSAPGGSIFGQAPPAAAGGGFGAVPGGFGSAPAAPSGQPSMFAQAFQQQRPPGGARGAARRRR
eukprot:TRINITY_DN7243_c0_g1_i1.p1 TRINITY_DN7243_c0_g1~~TRINITY_DN7243_c0_g1_i1.p1  ORF type:complete len:182 (-),score=46.21 TRINITY_DN7243_c0_g1_i1:512-1057(-)